MGVTHDLQSFPCIFPLYSDMFLHVLLNLNLLLGSAEDWNFIQMFSGTFCFSFMY